jgi:lipoyl(octanoyl) transferase
MPAVEWHMAEDFVPYDQAVAQMEARVAAIHEGDLGELVWLIEHPPLYTAGTSAKASDLLDHVFRSMKLAVAAS